MHNENILNDNDSLTQAYELAYNTAIEHLYLKPTIPHETKRLARYLELDNKAINPALDAFTILYNLSKIPQAELPMHLADVYNAMGAALTHAPVGYESLMLSSKPTIDEKTSDKLLLLYTKMADKCFEKGIELGKYSQINYLEEWDEIYDIKQARAEDLENIPEVDLDNIINNFKNFAHLDNYYIPSGTLLNMTVKLNLDEISGLLIEGGVDINASEVKGKSLIIEAMLGDSYDIAMQLIKAGADVNAQNFDGETPFSFACYRNFNSSKNNPQMQELLAAIIDAGGNVDYLWKNGKSTLENIFFGFEYHNSLSTPNYEFDKGAINLISKISRNGEKFFDIAEHGGTLLNRLIGRKHDVWVGNAIADLLDSKIITGKQIEKYAKHEYLLIKVIKNANNPKLTTALINSDVDLDMQYPGGIEGLYFGDTRLDIGDTPLKAVLDSKISDGFNNQEIYDTIKILSKNGEQFSKINQNDEFEYIIKAYKTLDTKIFTQLVKDGIISGNPIINQYGNTILHDAVSKGSNELVALLLYQGIDPNVRNKAGSSPLDHTIAKGDEEIFNKLLNSYKCQKDQILQGSPIPSVNVTFAEGMQIKLLQLFNKTLRHNIKSKLDKNNSFYKLIEEVEKSACKAFYKAGLGSIKSNALSVMQDAPLPKLPSEVLKLIVKFTLNSDPMGILLKNLAKSSTLHAENQEYKNLFSYTKSVEPVQPVVEAVGQAILDNHETLGAP